MGKSKCDRPVREPRFLDRRRGCLPPDADHRHQIRISLKGFDFLARGDKAPKIRNPDLYPDLTAGQEKGTSQLGCVSVAAGATLIVRCRSYNFQFFLQM
jgi:hypothetical protein